MPHIPTPCGISAKKAVGLQNVGHYGYLREIVPILYKEFHKFYSNGSQKFL